MAVADTLSDSTDCSFRKILDPAPLQVVPLVPLTGAKVDALAMSTSVTPPGMCLNPTAPLPLVVIAISEVSDAMSTFLGF